MGERKGVNKYYPPDWNPNKGNLNKYHGTHALRERARKLHMGILIIRFEMPYNIWCEGCKNHIGTGVRYNAEKKKVGMYYTTPIYQFRMKCHLCDNHFEIKTDPANLDYVIISGARRQERRWDPTENEQIVPEEKATSHKLATDSMFRLEHGTEDSQKSKDSKPALACLEAIRERMKDDYVANCVLRDQLRKKKKEQSLSFEKDNILLKKSSLNINLLPENDEDKKMASLLRLLPSQNYEERHKQKILEIENRSIFSTPSKIINSPLRAAIERIRQNKSVNQTGKLSRMSLGIQIGSEKDKNQNEMDKVKSDNVEDTTKKLITKFPALENGTILKEQNEAILCNIESSTNVNGSPVKVTSLVACDYGTSSDSD